LDIILMSKQCNERLRLEKEHTAAAAHFDAAGERLNRRIGISAKKEFESLQRDADEAWAALVRARNELDAHVREHRCQFPDGALAVQ
jgi:hypothetical protein